MNDDRLDDLLREAARSYNAPPAPPRDEMWANIESARRLSAAAVPVHSARAGWWRPVAGIAAVLLAGIAIGRATRPVATVPVTASDVAAREPTAPIAPRQVASVPSGTVEPVVGAYSQPEPARTRSGAPASGSVPDSPRASMQVATRRAGAGSTYGVPRHMPGLVGEGTEMNAYRLAVVEHLARTEVLLTGFRSTSAGGGRATRSDAEQFGVLSRELLQNTRLLLATHATDDPALTRLLQDLELVLMQIAQYAVEGGARHGDLDAINQSLDRRNVLPKLRSTIPAGAPAPAGT